MKPAFALLLLASLAPAQQPAVPNSLDPPPEPEAADVFYALRNGRLLPLERQTSMFQHRATGFMVMSTKSVLQFPGPQSPVRFHSEEQLELIFRTALKLDTMDPNTLYCVRKLDVTKKTREYTFSTGRVTPVGGSNKTNPLASVVPAQFSTYGEHSLKIAVGPLGPGEYAAGRLHGPIAYCFGVD